MPRVPQIHQPDKGVGHHPAAVEEGPGYAAAADGCFQGVRMFFKRSMSLILFFSASIWGFTA
jgi:hypothetical protein